MGDPISIARNMSGWTSLGIQATQSLIDVCNSYKYQDSEIAGTTERLVSLLSILQPLEKILSDREFQIDERSLNDNIKTSIQSCDELIQDLQGECQKFKQTTSSGIQAESTVAEYRATYPFRLSTLQRLNEDIEDLRANLLVAIDVLELKDNKKIQDDITDAKLLLESVRTRHISANIRNWLKAPDALVNQNAAAAKKHSDTGVWFVKGSTFTTWLTEENSFLWLNGFAGSGKSILASTIIDFAFQLRRSNPKIGIAYFYYTFNDESKQDESAMLRALLLQLSEQLGDSYWDLTDLTDLRNLFKAGIPPSLVLTDYLRRFIQKFHHVYIVLDALDESPCLGARGYVLDTLEMMQKWSLPGLHLLVTSRDEEDIRSCLDVSPGQEVEMRNDGIDKDIADFVSAQLQERGLQKWLRDRNKIQETLSKRAQGVFRWVDYQLKSLRYCPRSVDHLDCQLNSKFQSLDKTYGRILWNIDDSLVEDAPVSLTNG